MENIRSMDSHASGYKAIPFIPVFLLVLLLAFPALSVEGAANGLALWFQVVLPTLAPFMICTQMIVGLGGVSLLIRPVYPFLYAVFRLSPSGSYVLLCGLLCGYPLGARLCADFYERGELSSEEARYLLSICNHPSPMFLLGFIRGLLPFPIPGFLLPLCLYLPILPISWISRRRYGFSGSAHVSGMHASATKGITLESILLSTAETMVLIGNYMMLFSILAVWIWRIPLLPDSFKALLSGIAEITTGIRQICQVYPPDQILLPAAAVTAFGGLSGLFQTKGILSFVSDPRCGAQKNAGLSIRHYVLWKLLHAGLTCLILVTAENLLRQLPHL